MGGVGWSFEELITFRTATEEEVRCVRELIENARPARVLDERIQDIIVSGAEVDIMAVFGAGAFYYYDDNSGYDVTKDFLEQECFCIGYEKKDASALYEMLRRVKIGDIVYLKSFKVGKKGESGSIFIKAIGFVIGQNIKSFTFSDGSDMGYGRKVKWIKDFSDREDWINIELDPRERVNNVYSNTLYEEYSARIISTIIDLLV